MPARSSQEWEQVGTAETDPNEHWESPVAVQPQITPAVSPPLGQAEDPQPYNPVFDLRTGITDWISLRALGARGDGKADDTGIFQAANLIAASSGQMLYIAAGTYRLTANVVFSAGVQWLNMGTISGGFTLSGGTQLSFGGGSTGFVNPMTTPGDTITGGTGGAPQRLPAGSNGQVLGIAAAVPAWINNPAGFANPMTTPGDTITGGTGGTPTRLPVSATNGQVLQVVDGAVAWATSMGLPVAGPDAAHPTVFKQADNSMVVVPLSFYSLTGDDSTWINAAFAHLPVITGGAGLYGGTYTGPWTVGRVRLLPLGYIITAGIIVPTGATTILEGSGPGTILFVGSGATGIYSHSPAGGPQQGVPALQTHGTIRDMRIDGAAGGAVGLDVGGGWGQKIYDVTIANFAAAGAIGLRLNNATSGEWTEKARIRCDLLHNTNACVIENSSGSASNTPDSFEYNDIDLYIMCDNPASPAQSGVILRGGAFLSGGSFRVRGNFPSNSGPVLTITGNDGNGNWSKIFHNFMDITVESNTSVNPPQTINFGNANNTLNNCMGMLTFQFTNWTPSNVLATGSAFGFGGVIDGDANLTAANSRPAGWI